MMFIKKVDNFDRSSNRMSILKGRKIPYNNDETFLYNSVKKADKIWTAIGPIFLISSDYIQLLNSRNLGLSEDKTTSCMRLYSQRYKLKSVTSIDDFGTCSKIRLNSKMVGIK